MPKHRTYKVHFFVCTHQDDRTHSLIRNLFDEAEESFLDAKCLSGDADEHHQVRSIVRSAKGRVIKGVFGKWRNNVMPEQANAEGKEADVRLRPGYGLVEKNFFVYYTDQNLLLYQRNASGSHPSKFQAYFSQLAGSPIGLEPILTRDSYQRVLNGGEPKWVEISVQPPKDPDFYGDEWTSDAMRLLNGAGAHLARIRMSASRAGDAHLLGRIKDAVVDVARSGRARVARIRLEEDNEPIDLIADRIIESITVELNEKGRPNPDDIFAAIAALRDKRKDDLKTFFGK